MDAQIADLEELEKQAFRKFYDDGLLDLLLGLMMVAVSVGYWIQESRDNEVLSMLVLWGIAVVLVVVLKIVKTRLLRSRLGQFTPRRERRRRINATRFVLLGSMILGVVAFALGAAAQSEDLSLGAVDVWLPLVWFVYATVVLGIMAHMLDVPRFALYGVLFGLVGPLLIWPDAIWDFRVPPPLAFGIPAMPIIGIGIWKLATFLRENPVQSTEQSTAGRSAG